MPAVELRVPPVQNTPPNALPQLLQTPSGLAIIEIQGTIHHPSQNINQEDAAISEPSSPEIGRLEFPLYDSSALNDEKWMKKVYLYIGKYQRLTGEVKKLAKPFGVLQKVGDRANGRDETIMEGRDEAEALEIAEVVRYKILFSGRPEPVGE
jgi:chromosome transmission fidelity protein 8